MVDLSCSDAAAAAQLYDAASSVGFFYGVTSAAPDPLSIFRTALGYQTVKGSQRVAEGTTLNARTAPPVLSIFI